MIRMVFWALVCVLVICGFCQIALGLWAGLRFLEVLGAWLKKIKREREYKEPFSFLKYAPTDRPKKMLRLQ